ncbi:MAG: hypothetical protein NT154_15135, partial [Verrucomicrobia bacterium]|nr:hypothetical protein [Verrucomicrobiota bacterium]
SISNIVKETAITEKTVKTYVKELVAEGILKKVAAANYTKKMKPKMVYYQLDKAAYDKEYWTEQDEEVPKQTSKGVTATPIADTKQGGNAYPHKGVTAPAEGGKDSGEGGKDYSLKGVTATPSYDIEEEVKEELEKDGEKDVQTSVRVSSSKTLPDSNIVTNQSASLTDSNKASLSPLDDSVVRSLPDPPRNDGTEALPKKGSDSGVVSGQSESQDASWPSPNLKKWPSCNNSSNSNKSTTAKASADSNEQATCKNAAGSSAPVAAKEVATANPSKYRSPEQEAEQRLLAEGVLKGDEAVEVIRRKAHTPIIQLTFLSYGCNKQQCPCTVRGFN